MTVTKYNDDDGDFDRLVEAALAGDEDAVNELLRFLKPEIINHCRGRIGRSQGTFADADDVAQDVLLAVFYALSSYQDRGGKFRAFVHGIARNKIYDYYRRTSRERQSELDETADVVDGTPGPETVALLRERGTRIAGLLERLSEHQREVLVLRFILGYSGAEIAEALASTPGAVRVTQNRALTNLRKQLRAASVSC